MEVGGNWQIKKNMDTFATNREFYMKPSRIDPLTGVRAIAAVMVFLYHHRKYWRNDIPSFVLNFLNEFHIGVSVFFVLSGFVIAYVYGDGPMQSRRSYLQYLLIRIFRIFPVYLMLLTLKYVALGFPSGKETFLTYTLLHGFSDSYNLSGIPQAWSLSVELCFYLVAPLIFLLCRKSLLNTIAFLVLLLFLFLLSGLVWHGLDSNPDSFLYPPFFVLNTTFPGRAVEFLAGVLLARAVNGEAFASVKKMKWKTWIGGVTMLGLIYIISLWEPDVYHHGTDKPFGLALRNLVLPFSVALFLWGLITEKTLLQRILGSKLLVLMGNASYVFYLIHIGYINKRLCDIHYFPDHNFVMLWLVAIIIYLLIERPFYETMKKLIKKKLANANA